MAGCASPLAGLRAGPASLALLVLAVAWTAPFAADAFPAFRDEIPNGLRSVRAADPAHHFTGEQSYRALGHILAEGGGKLNAFGEAFRAAGFEWTDELCRADTDGDGEPNGHELGDPCCLWKPGETPMRQWGVSHPGIRTSFTNITFDYEKTCVRKEGNGAFWDFYFQSPDDIKNPFKTVDVDVAEWVAAKRALVKQQGGYTATLLGIFRNREGQTLMVSTKNFFSLMVLGVAAATLGVLVLSHRCCACCSSLHRGAMSPADHVKLLLGAALYTDVMSGILHIVLDNPVMNTWPVIGPEALAFQGHHFDPTGVARGPILDMVREDHLLVFLVMTVFLVLRPTSPGLLTFSLHFGWMSHFMMASHRWSHTHPKYLHWTIKSAQEWGLLMTTEHHSRHHASYDCNFAIFSGVSNPIFNKLIYVIHWRSPLWFFLLCGGIVLPPFLSANDNARTWCGAVPSRIGAWLLSRPAFFSPRSAVARVCKGWSARMLRAPQPSVNRPDKTVVLRTSKDADVEGGTDKLARSSSSPNSKFAVTFRGQELTSVASRRVAARGAVLSGVLIATMMIGSLLARKVGLTNEGEAAPMLVILHVACMSLATLVCSVVAVTSYAFVQPGARNKPHIRKRHRMWNMLSAALMMLGTVLILVHVTLRHERIVRPRSIHMWLALAVGVGVTVQITAGVLKHAALAAGRGVKRFTWHGEVGWAVFVGMLFTVNSGIVESDLFTGLTFLQMTMQVLLFGPVGLGAAHSLGRLPAISLHLDDPVAYLLREHLDAWVPDAFSVWLTRPTSCLHRCRPRRIAGGRTKRRDHMVVLEKARQWAVAVVIVLAIFVLWDVTYHWNELWAEKIVADTAYATVGHSFGNVDASANHLPGHPSRISIF